MKFVNKVLISAARYSAVVLIMFVAKKGWIDPESVEGFTAVAGGIILIFLTAVWEKYKDRLGFLIGLELPEASTPQDVKAVTESLTAKEGFEIVFAKPQENKPVDN